MAWKVTYCRSCGKQIEWVFENGRKVALNFEGLGKRGEPHLSTCSNPDYFKKKHPDKRLTKARQELLRNPWWAK